MIRFLVLFCFSLPVLAAPVSFQMNNVRLVDFVRLVYSEVLQKSYVLDSEFVKNEDVVTLHLRNVEPQEVERKLDALLKARGFSSIGAGAIQIVGKPFHETEEKHVVVYRPSYRSVSYLLELVQSLFPQGAFSGQRGIQQINPQLASAHGVAAGAPVAQSQNVQPQQMPVSDPGTSAYSRLDKADQDIIIFQGTDNDAKRLASVLAQLDKPAGELVVKAVVYEVRSAAKEGNALKLAASILSGKLGVVVNTGKLDQNAIKISFGDFEAIYSALATDSRFKLVSSPTMRVKSGSSARFVAGADVPVLGNVTYPNNGQPVQSVEYKQSGVILDIKPHMRELVTDLTINQQISTFVQTTTGVNNSPTLLKRELQTQISTKDGEIIVLGGLEENQDTNESSGLSFLPDFLKAKSDDKQRTEIMVILDARRI